MRLAALLLYVVQGKRLAREVDDAESRLEDMADELRAAGEAIAASTRRGETRKHRVTRGAE